MTAVFVAGATGVLGAHTVRRLVSAGHEVIAMARTEAAARALRDQGARPVLADLLDPAGLGDAVRGSTVVVHIATAIPRDPADPQAWLANDRVRVDGTRNLLRAAREGGAQRYVQQSITRLYGDHGDEWIDETEPLGAEQPAHLRSAVEMESLVSSTTDMATVILRGGQFYGAGTGTTEQMFAAARAGELRLDGTGEHYISPIHPEDMAQAVVLAADATLPPGVFNVVDDEPVRQRDFHDAVLALANPGCRVVAGTGRNPPSRRCSVRKLTSFGFTPAYPDHRIGLRAAATSDR